MWILKIIYLFGLSLRFQHFAGHITRGSFVGRGSQHIHLVQVLYCKPPTFSKQLPTFSHKVRGLNHLRADGQVH